MERDGKQGLGWNGGVGYCRFQSESQKHKQSLTFSGKTISLTGPDPLWGEFLLTRIKRQLWEPQRVLPGLLVKASVTVQLLVVAMARHLDVGPL